MNQVNKISRILISILAIITITLPVIMDLNETHAYHPEWTAHARFHFWIAFFSLIGTVCLSLYLLWGNYKDKGSRISVVVAGLCPVLFWGAFYPAIIMTNLNSAWPDGVEPFTPIAPQLIMGLIICLLSFYAIWLDGKSRKET